MSVTTSGLQSKSSSRVIRSVIEVLSSMRFAIALLVILSIASIIGDIPAPCCPGATELPPPKMLVPKGEYRDVGKRRGLRADDGDAMPLRSLPRF